MKSRPNKIAVTVALLVAFSVALDASLAPIAKIASKNIDEAIIAAEKISGRTLASSGRVAARKALEKAVIQHGDDALRAAQGGGLELSSEILRTMSWKGALR